MTSLLSCAYVEHHCNACGGTYRDTLEQLLIAQRALSEWDPVRPCSVCSGSTPGAFESLAPELVEALQRAWDDVARAAAEAGIQLKVGG